MTENSKEKQNEIDAEQALKDFLKELVLSPLEVQQNNFLPKLKNTVQDSISVNEDIKDTKSSVEAMSKNIDIVLEKYVDGNTKFIEFEKASNSALALISKTLNESKNDINILKSTSVGLSTNLDEFNEKHISILSKLEEKFEKEIKELSIDYNKSLALIKSHVTDEFNKTHDEINKRSSTLSIEILKHYRLGLFFSIAVSILLLVIITLIIIK